MAKVAATRTPEDIAREINKTLVDPPVKLKRLVKQRDLEDLAEKMERKKELAKEVEALKVEIEKAELIIAHAIENGGNVERGDLAASVEVRPGQRRPSWKDYYASLAGPVAVERAINETASTAETKHVRLSRKGVAL